MRKIARLIRKKEASDDIDTVTDAPAIQSTYTYSKQPITKLPTSLDELHKLIKFDDVVDE